MRFLLFAFIATLSVFLMKLAPDRAEAGVLTCISSFGDGYELVSPDPAQLRNAEAQNCVSATVRCESPGWYAYAKPEPPRVPGDASGFACGFATRATAEAAAKQECEASGFACFANMSGRDDGKTFAEERNLNEVLKDSRQYGSDGEMWDGQGREIGRWR